MNFFEHIEGITTTKLALIKNTYKLFKLEAKLAGLNIYPLLIKLGLLITFLLTAWLMAVVMLGYLILPLFKNNIIATLSLLFALNTGLLVWVGKSLSTCLSRMSFTKTRAVLAENESLKEHHEIAERTIALDKPIRKRNPSRTRKSGQT